MKTLEAEVEVNVPIPTAYNQWTQFEDFPEFMDGVESVRQVSDSTQHWVAEVAGKRKEWEAHITEQEPDRLIAWEGFGTPANRGRVFFEPAGDGLGTRVRVSIDYETEGVVEGIGDALGFLERRVQGDLDRFKDFIEGRQHETGAWRGEIHEPPQRSAS
jgi:uncharacterized membrane protein